MKRIIIFLNTLFFLIVSINAQISVVGQAAIFHKKYPGIDYLIVFNGLDSNSAIQYNGSSSSVNWYKFSNLSTSISNQKENYNIDDATGYILETDGGVKESIWVLDYQNYLVSFNSIAPLALQTNECEGLDMTLDANVPLMKYMSTSGNSFNIDREFKLSYQSKEWNNEWEDITVERIVFLPSANISIAQAPLCDTRFKIEGDQFAEILGIQSSVVESDIYLAKAVEAHITHVATTRDELNEDQRPSSATVLEGSAPLELLFKSNANVPVAQFYRWEIYKDQQLLFVRNDEDQRYTFGESGNFMVKLIASNAHCYYADSVSVKISESALQVPTVFTPNGDNINDEFRVAYRSLDSFKAWIYNRWGRKVYSWEDPQKGWDGRINGKEAAEGAYIYLIEAVGTDGQKYKLKGVVNLLRGRKN